MPKRKEDQNRKDEDIRSRGFWSGTITFGLVSIPVALYPGNRTRRVSLRMLAPDGTPLKRRYYCPKEDRPIPDEEIVRGYEYEKSRFVVVTDEELEALEPKKSREIDLRRFVPADQIGPMYFDRAYYFSPTGDSQKPYRLLAEVMEKTRQAGIATFVMRGKEYLVAILSENGILRAETLRFADEIRTPEDVGLPTPVPAPNAMVKEIDKAIEAKTAEKLDWNELEDFDSQRLLELTRRKKASGEGIVHPLQESMEEEKEGAEVIDIMEALKRSVERAHSSESKPQKGSTSAAASKKSFGLKLQNKSKKELYENARKIDIPGRSAMDKDALIEAIRNAAE